METKNIALDSNKGLALLRKVAEGGNIFAAMEIGSYYAKSDGADKAMKIIAQYDPNASEWLSKYYIAS